MYLRFFGFAERPFNVTPDPRFLYLSAHHQEALAILTYGVRERKGFLVLTGEVGSGKTTLLHTLLDRLDPNVRAAYLFNTSLSQADLMRAVVEDFGVPTTSTSVGDLVAELNAWLIDRLARGENSVLIIDEAQNLSRELLESVRLLSNLETSKEKLLQLVLVGQPELNLTLNHPSLRQLKQRISLRYHIPPLTRTETLDYIVQRLRIAGATGRIFTDRALDEIYYYSRGIPRLINILADNALLTAYAKEQRLVDDGAVIEAVRDLEPTGETGFRDLAAAEAVDGDAVMRREPEAAPAWADDAVMRKEPEAAPAWAGGATGAPGPRAGRHGWRRLVGGLVVAAVLAGLVAVAAGDLGPRIVAHVDRWVSGERPVSGAAAGDRGGAR
ncbi:MAG TPA: AAA family ATPase [Thermodesulfobacteriota bacterium]